IRVRPYLTDFPHGNLGGELRPRRQQFIDRFDVATGGKGRRSLVPFGRGSSAPVLVDEFLIGGEDAVAWQPQRTGEQDGESRLHVSIIMQASVSANLSFCGHW